MVRNLNAPQVMEQALRQAVGHMFAPSLEAPKPADVIALLKRTVRKTKSKYIYFWNSRIYLGREVQERQVRSRSF